MAIVRLQDSELTNIGNAIRGKLNVTKQYLPKEMAPAILTIPKEKGYVNWGSETQAGAGTAQWWANLKSWVKTATVEDLATCVGKQKSVTLSTAVLGTTTHQVRCIGYNCNRDKTDITRNTLTFETVNSLAQSTKVSSDGSDVMWRDSLARQQCKNYYNAFPGRASICQVQLVTYIISMNTLGSLTDTAFIVSQAEMAVSAEEGRAISNEEFDLRNEAHIPYQYYATKPDLRKRQGDTGDLYWYMLRSPCVSGSVTGIVGVNMSEPRKLNGLGMTSSIPMPVAFAI